MMRAYTKGPHPTPPLERLFRYVRVNEGCWEWTGNLNKGYGQFTAESTPAKIVRPYRYLYEALYGPIGDLDLDHLCTNTSCVRPDHLEPVTHLENMRRGVAAMRTHCPHGHPYDDRNTYRTPRGHRRCRMCGRRADADRGRRRNAA